MKFKLIIFTMLFLFISISSPARSFFNKKKDSDEGKTEVNVTTVMVMGIPAHQSTIFIPLEFNENIANIQTIDLEKLRKENIVAVISMSGGKTYPGIGLLKLDPAGIPRDLEFKIIFKPKRNASLDVSTINFAPIPALPAKGSRLNENINAYIDHNKEYEVFGEEDSPEIELKDKALSVNIKRKLSIKEKLFIPIFYDSDVLDLKSTKGSLVAKPGVEIKVFNSFMSGSAGIELVLSEKAGLNFSVDLRLAPVAAGKTKFSLAYPQAIRTNLIQGPIVEFAPSSIIVFRTSEIEQD